jgi:hypothetical protein
MKGSRERERKEDKEREGGVIEMGRKMRREMVSGGKFNEERE